jgi:uncharacterized protein (DUF1015 family)
MTIYPIQAVLPDLNKIEVTDAFFETVREDYPAYVAQNKFKTTTQKGVYLYEIITSQSEHLGLVAALDLADVRSGKVKKHEKTLVAKEKTQLNLLIERGAMVKPVLLTYRMNLSLLSLFKELKKDRAIFHEVFFPESQQRHRFWLIEETSLIQQIQNEFAQIEQLYVADGHHRLTANLHFEAKARELNITDNFDEVFCAFFDDTQLKIEAFNRIVKDMSISEVELLQKLNDIATPIECDNETPRKKGEWKMCIDEQWTTWSWKSSIKQFRGIDFVNLDVDILNELVFKSIFNISDIRKDKRIGYLDATYDKEALTAQSKKGIVFSLFPVDIHDLFQIADADGTMPPKSTWFEPRMKNGLLVQEIPPAFHL